MAAEEHAEVRQRKQVRMFFQKPWRLRQPEATHRPLQLPSPQERQGEAIGFADGDSAFVTISEGVQPPVNCARLPRLIN